MPSSAISNEPPAQDLGRGFVRMRAQLGYDGTAFAGWAIQKSLRTVQGDVQRAIAIAMHLDEVDVFVAGRTDSGVHARGQVIHFDVPEETEIDLFRLLYSINNLTEDDIQFHSLTFAPAGFDARFAALARRYSYSIADGKRDPLRRNFMYEYWRELDVDAMNEASAKLIGLNDFSAFCKRTDYGTSIRQLEEFSWERTEFGVEARVKADAFCHSMVRSLIGGLVPVGAHRRDVNFPYEVMIRRERHDDVVTMPPHGLVLEEVYYPVDSELAARQEITRARRDSADLCE